DKGCAIGARQIESHWLPLVQRLKLLGADNLERHEERLIAIGRHPRGGEGRQKRQSPSRRYSSSLPGRSGRNGLKRKQDGEHKGDRKARVKVGPKRHQEREPPRRFLLLDCIDE